MKSGGTVGLRITLDGSQMNREIAKSRRELKGLGDEVMMESRRMESAFSGIGRSLGGLAGAWSLKALASEVVKVRGEIESTQAVLETFTKSRRKAAAMMSDIVATAATTPFGVQELADGTARLMAFGVEAGRTNDILLRLGDISAGLKQPLGDLIYLYGTTMTQGRLYTQDYNQFVSRGIPMGRELAAVMGVAESEVRGLVEEGKVGFAEVQAVINRLTSAGGQFYGLMSNQSTTVEGKISNLEDAFDQMLNKIGSDNEGMIYGAIDGAMLLVENYEAVGDVLMTLVADYGIYKATLMAVTAYTNACYNYEIAQLKTVVAEKGAEIDADLASAVSKGRMTAQRAAEVQALRQEVASKIEAATVTSRVASAEAQQARVKYESYQVTVSLSKMRVAQAQQELAAAQATGDATAIESAKTNLNTAIKERNNVARQSSILKRNMERATVNANAAAQARETLVTKADTAAKKINATTTSLLTLCTKGLTKALNALRAAMAKNPFGLILVAATTVIGAMMTMNEVMSATSEEVEHFGESAVKLKGDVDMLFAVLAQVSSDTNVYKQALDELNQIYREYGIISDGEIKTLQELIELRLQLTDAIEKEGMARQAANKIAQLNELKKTARETASDALSSGFSTAEWDGTAELIDDYDAKEIQKNYQIAQTLALQIMDAGIEARETAEAVKNKIYKAFFDKGWFSDREYTGGSYPRLADLDVDLEEIYNNYKNNVVSFEQDITEAQAEIERKAAEEEAKQRDEAYKTWFRQISDPQKLEDFTFVIKEFQHVLDENPITPHFNGAVVSDGIWETLKAVGGFALDGFEMLVHQRNSKYYSQAIAKLENNIKTAKTENERQKYIQELQRLKGDLDIDSTAYKDVTRLLEKYGSIKNNQVRKELEERKKAEENAGKQLLSLQQQIARDEIGLMQEGHKKRMAQLELEYKEQKNRIEQQIKELSDLNKKAGTTGLNENGLTAEQQEAIDKMTTLNNDKRKNDINELLNAEILALDEYLREYGTFEQRKAAIARLYAEKIEKAATNGERLRLEAEMEREVGNVDAERMLDSVNMASVFEDFGLILTEPLRQSVDELRRYTETDAFRSRSLEDQKSIFEAIARAEQAMNGIGGLNFNEVGYAVATYNNALAERLTAETALAEAERSLRNAQEELNEAIRNGDEAAQEAAQSQYEAAEQAYASAQSNYSRANSKVAQTQTAANKSLAKFNDTLSKIDGTVRELYNGSLKAIWDLLGNKFHTKMGALVSGTLELTTQFDGLNKVLRDNGSSVADFAESLSAALRRLSGLSVENVSEKGSAAISEQFVAQFDNPEMYSAVSDTLSGKFKEIFNTALQNGSSVQEATEQAASGIGELIQNIGKAGESTANLWGAIIGLVLQLLDEFGENGLGRFVGTLLENIGEAVSGILGNLLTDFVPQVINGIGDVLAGVVDGVLNLVTFGGAGSFKDAITEGFGLSNAKKVQETIERLTDRNELLTVAIESLTEEMKVSRGTQSVEVYRRLRDYQAEVNQNYLDIAKAQSGYYGSHHSWGHYWRKSGGFTDEEIARMSKAIGRSWDGSLWSLSPEEMEILRSFPDIWKRMQDAGKGGYGKRVTDKLDDYIEQAGKLEELQNQLYEGLTGISFESMYDSFVDSLMDMKYDAKDAAEDISEYFTRAMLSNKIGDIMADDLEEWWKKFGAAMEDGSLSYAERENLLNEYLGYMDEAAHWRDEIFAATGYSSEDPESQDSTRKGFATASQDSIDEMNGRATGIQMAVEEIKTQNALMSTDVHGVRLDMAMIRQYTDELRGLSLAAVNHLADISRNTYQLYEMNERLAQIEKNTRAL